MPETFENTIAEFIDANGLFRPHGGILVAVSGGADSMALMYVLNSLTAQLAGRGGRTLVSQARRLTIAHINHQLRGSLADDDEAFVIEKASALGLPVLTKRVAVADYAARQKLSIETAARKLRIDALVEMANQKGCSFIATAHHKGDNAETIVHRLLRGTAWRGLAGIRPAKEFAGSVTFVRPLLCVSRRQIIAYLNQSNIIWRHDHTNDDQTFTRNFIRHSLLPALQSQSSQSLVELLDRLSSHCRKYVDLIDRQIDGLWPQLVVGKENDRIELSQKVFDSAPVPLKAEIVRRALLAVGSGQRDLTQDHYERILRFAKTNRPNKSLSLPGGFVVRGGKNLVFKKSCGKAPASSDLPWKIETQILDAKQCDIEEFKRQKTQYAEWFDADKIVGKLAIRPRKSGDSFWPIGLAAPKKIGKFLTDAHVNDELRKSVCILEDSEKIIWFVPIRASQETKVTAETQRILQITCSPQKFTP